MPIIKSAQKRVRVARKATIRNVKTKRNLKESMKAIENALKGGKKSAGSEFQRAQSAIDTAVKKGVLHKNKAARKKARLSKVAMAAGVSVAAAGTKKAASNKKAAPKKVSKTAVKKAPAKKKPAVKKK